MEEATTIPTRGLMTSEKLCETALRIIVAGNLPFSHAENPELVANWKHAYPSCNIPNRRSVATLLKKMAKEERFNLKKELANNESKVSLAMDAWTSANNLAFLGTVPAICDKKVAIYSSFGKIPATSVQLHVHLLLNT
jgi:hypothetical protein